MKTNFNQLANTPNLLSVLKSLQENTLSKINCMRIGVINKILSPTEVLCSITNKMLMSTNNDGTGVWKEYPEIYCHVWFLGNADTGINHKLTIGSPVLMMFNDREIDSFFETGEISTLSSLRTHSLNDCIAIPLYQPKETTTGISLKSNTLDINTGKTTITANGGISIDSPDVSITGNLNVGTGISAVVPCGMVTLTFSNGILTGVT